MNIGILTAGGDSPGLNAAIRAIGKSAIQSHDASVIGFKDGFRGLMQNRSIRLDRQALSGILTHGGTILGTSRDKPHKMDMGGQNMDMTDTIFENFERHHLDVLMCLGGGGTQKNALRLHKRGLPIITLPKTIDNDVFGTDASFGFDTALTIATEAVDRLHSTAHSHHRIMLVEVMGHNAGWLALGAGLAGGADVILIPELPYNLEAVAASIDTRHARGSTFSIVAISEGAHPGDGLTDIRNTSHLAEELEARTNLESRVTILGHVQRGGAPSAVDRLLATRLGTRAVECAAASEFGVMIASRGEGSVALPLEEVAGKRHVVPADHRWISAARSMGVSFGQEI